MALKINNQADMEAALEQMSPEQREHLKVVLNHLVECYLNDDTHGLLLVTGGEDPYLKILAINSTDMEAAGLLGSADQFLNFRLLDDAPPKEMMN